MRRYFITGGTGFIGRELVRQLLERDDTESVICLTRGGRKDLLTHDKLQYWKGDITNCDFPGQESCITDVIHGANEVNDLLQPDQMRYYYTIVEGTNRLLKWAYTTKVQRTLILSSGAVARDTIYGHAKRQCEYLARIYLGNTKIARIFSVIGPEMPLNGQYAAGRFVGHALQGRVVLYGGASIRTYIDVRDCANWLLHILYNAPDRTPIDVAGNDEVLISDLARLVAKVFNVQIEYIVGPGRSDAYLPDLTAATELGLSQTIDLKTSLERIREHHKALSYLRHPYLEPAT